MDTELRELFNDIKMISQGLEEMTISYNLELSKEELLEIFDKSIELTVATKDALLLIKPQEE